jgi:hypothetical protein
MKINSLNFSYLKDDFQIKKLEKKNIKDLYNFFKKFNNVEKEFFGYPLFQPTNLSFKRFKLKYEEYIKEKNTWYYFLLFKKKNLIGLSYVKKIGFKNKKNETNKSPVLGGPYLLKKFRGKKLGFILLNTVINQLRLLKIKKLYSRHEIQNKSAIKNSINCGLKATGKKYLNKNKNFDYEFLINIK